MGMYKNSRYTKTPVYARQGSTFIFGIREKAKFDKNKAVYYTILQGDTVDGIAYRFYGKANLYWVILDANNLLSEFDIKVGDSLMIPAFEEVVNTIE